MTMDFQALLALIEAGDANALAEVLDDLDAPENADIRAAIAALASSRINALLEEIQPWMAFLSVTDTVEVWLEEQGFAPEGDDEGGFDFTLPVHEQETSASFIVDEELTQLVCYLHLVEESPEDARVRVSEYLHRANAVLPLGNFELDVDSGDILIKAALDYEGQILSETLLLNLVSAVVSAAEHFGEGLQAVIEGAPPVIE